MSIISRLKLEIIQAVHNALLPLIGMLCAVLVAHLNLIPFVMYDVMVNGVFFVAVWYSMDYISLRINLIKNISKHNYEPKIYKYSIKTRSSTTVIPDIYKDKGSLVNVINNIIKDENPLSEYYIDGVEAEKNDLIMACME